MATAIVVDRAVSLNAPSAGLLRMAAVRKRYGLGRCTILRLVSEGKILAYRGHANGWWLYDPASIEAFLGMASSFGKEKEKHGKSVAIYARRSDQGTKANDSLENQISLLLEFVENKHGVSGDDVVIYKECVSGVSLRGYPETALGVKSGCAAD